MQDGLTEEKIAELERYQESDAFTPQEKIALRERFTDAQIVELGIMIGQYIGLGRLVAVLDLERPACTL